MSSFNRNMRITAVNTMSFKSEEPHFSAYDDAVSQARREYIREHYDSWRMPYQSIYEREGRLEEYNLNKLISNYTDIQHNISKPHHHKSSNVELDYELLDNMVVWNNKPITNTNSYRGSTLADDLSNLQIAKKAGIKRVVDLEGYPKLGEACKEAGLEYFDFSIIDKFWPSHVCKSKETIVDRAIHFWRDIQGKDNKTVQEHIKQDLSKWNKNKDEAINMLIQFVKTMAQDNVYIGCMLGTLRTDNALMLNHFFNPQASNTPDYITWRNRELLDKLEILYNNLSIKDKKELGWTKEFEAAFLPKLEEAKKAAKHIKL